LKNRGVEICQSTRVLFDSPLTPEQHADLTNMYESAEALYTLVNQLLDFADLESGTCTLQERVFALRSTLHTALQPLRHQAQRKGLSLTTMIAPEVVDLLQGDPERLTQIIISLVKNAIKFTAEGSISLRVTLVSPVAQEITLHWSVTDTGIGLAEGQQATIFEAFRQADGSSTRLYGGLGLGLTIAAQWVALMGGNIWADSTGPGSTFHFTTRFGVAPPSMVHSFTASTMVSEATTCASSPVRLV